MDDMDKWIEAEADARRQAAIREEADTALTAKRSARRKAEAERAKRSAADYAAWVAEMKAAGEWLDDE